MAQPVRFAATVVAVASVFAFATGCKDTVRYNSCDEVVKAGKAPLHKGDPGYSHRLDRDGDGIACDQ